MNKCSHSYIVYLCSNISMADGPKQMTAHPSRQSEGVPPASFASAILPLHSGCRPWMVLQLHRTFHVQHQAMRMTPFK